MRILLAADSAGDVCALRDALLDQGHELVSARDGATVVQTVSGAAPPVLAILQAELTDTSAAELCRLLRVSPEGQGVHVIVLSSRGGTDEAVEALQAGADDFLNRPMEPAEMIARVRAAIRLVDYHAGVRDRLRSVLRADPPVLVRGGGPEPQVTPPGAGGGTSSVAGLQDILSTLLPPAALEAMLGQAFAGMGLGGSLAVSEADAAAFNPTVGVVDFMIMPDKAAWLDLLLETDTESARRLHESFTGMAAENVGAPDLVHVVGEILNVVQETLKAAFKASGAELLVPLVPQSISPARIPDRLAHSSILSRHLYNLGGIKLRFTLYASLSPVQRKPLRELGLASVLAEPLRPMGNNDLVLINKGTLLNHRALKKLENLAEFEPRNVMHSVIEPSPLFGLLSID